MSQSSFVAALLLAAFLLYLAVNNRLVTYAAILWGNTAAPLPEQNAPSGAALPGLDLSSATDPTATTGGLPGLPDFSGLGDGSGGFGSVIEQAAPALLEAL